MSSSSNYSNRIARIEKPGHRSRQRARRSTRVQPATQPPYNVGKFSIKFSRNKRCVVAKENDPNDNGRYVIKFNYPNAHVQQNLKVNVPVMLGNTQNNVMFVFTKPMEKSAFMGFVDLSNPYTISGERTVNHMNLIAFRGKKNDYDVKLVLSQITTPGNYSSVFNLQSIYLKCPGDNKWIEYYDKLKFTGYDDKILENNLKVPWIFMNFTNHGHLEDDRHFHPEHQLIWNIEGKANTYKYYNEGITKNMKQKIWDRIRDLYRYIPDEFNLTFKEIKKSMTPSIINHMFMILISIKTYEYMINRSANPAENLPSDPYSGALNDIMKYKNIENCDARSEFLIKSIDFILDCIFSKAHTLAMILNLRNKEQTKCEPLTIYEGYSIIAEYYTKLFKNHVAKNLEYKHLFSRGTSLNLLNEYVTNTKVSRFIATEPIIKKKEDEQMLIDKGVTECKKGKPHTVCSEKWHMIAVDMKHKLNVFQY